jgi:hypothetical protein
LGDDGAVDVWVLTRAEHWLESARARWEVDDLQAGEVVGHVDPLRDDSVFANAAALPEEVL